MMPDYCEYIELLRSRAALGAQGIPIVRYIPPEPPRDRRIAEPYASGAPYWSIYPPLAFDPLAIAITTCIP
jgi:hypothetical protein